jgi:DNA invertase Pin-like site-specific DNA recombinase
MTLSGMADVRHEDLTGRTWAGYVRESTRGQADRYGPEIQRSEQRRYADRYGLAPTGREYVDLVSGKDTLRRSDFVRMIADAEAGLFEVLLCYDTSRFARNVGQAYEYRDRLARAGVTIVFCSDGLISGNVDTFEVEGLKTVADAAYLRRLSRNVSRGYEQKWQMFNDPGGSPPLGFARVGQRKLLAPVEGPELDKTRRAFVLYAAGTWSDLTLADELGLTAAGLAEILTNPLYAGRAVRHKGRPDEEERPATFQAPVDPALFDRVQAMREERRTRHRGGPSIRRSYPLVQLMRCASCGSGYQGDANNGIRRVRHAQRPACATPASHRADVFEGQIADVMDAIHLTAADVRQVLGAMRVAAPSPPVSESSDEVASHRQALQDALAMGKVSLSAFNRAWRALDRPKTFPVMPPDEIRMGRARKLLSDFGTLWRDPAVPDELRAEALHEIFARVDVDGPQVVAVYPQENENAWLLGYHAMRRDVELVGAKGFEPSTS